MVRQRLAAGGSRRAGSGLAINRPPRAGHLGPIALDVIRRIAGLLVHPRSLLGRWRSGDLDRMLDLRHSQLHEAVATWFRHALPDWQMARRSRSPSTANGA